MYEELKKEIVDVLRFMEVKGLNHGRSGNVSIRVKGADHVLITPSSLPKARLSTEDIVVVSMSGEIIEGSRKPTVELPLHIAIYTSYNYFNAVIHAHPIYVTALAITREPLPPVVEEAVLYIGGEVRVAEYAPFGSRELAKNVVKALEDRSAAILPNHGVVTCGKSLEEALEVLVLVERLAQSYILSKVLGKITEPPDEVIKYLSKLFRERILSIE
ncbi:MAG: class II aldolase/adducin family protein [Desulfurococcaceae archaeon TW002]